MRHLLIAAALLSISCAAEFVPRVPPLQRFVYPTGLTHLDGAADSPEGTLYVVSSNFDRRFDSGGLTALDLTALLQRGLPAFGKHPVGTRPIQVTDLQVEEGNRVIVDNFGGDVATRLAPAGEASSFPVSLYVPSRSEQALVHAISADPAALDQLSCQTGPGQDCRQGAASLVRVAGASGDFPRIETPSRVGVGARGVYVTQEAPSDSPNGASQGTGAATFDNFLFQVDTEAPGNTGVGQFRSIGDTASHAIAVGSRYAYIAGRLKPRQGALVESPLVELVDLSQTRAGVSAQVEAAYASREARGIAVTGAEDRIYLAARNPDALLVLDVKGHEGASPVITLIKAIPLPDGASDVKIIERSSASGDNLVAVTCTNGHVLTIYDDRNGQVVSQLIVGEQPYAVTIDVRTGGGARLFVSNFRDGRVAVVDIPDLTVPQDTRLVAHLGQAQRCPTEGTLVGPCEQTTEVDP